MWGPFDKQAEMYVDARPTYSAHWYSMLASRTPRHSLARDVGAGNRQAALSVSPLSLSFLHARLEPFYCLS